MQLFFLLEAMMRNLTETIGYESPSLNITVCRVEQGYFVSGGDGATTPDFDGDPENKL